MQYISLSVNSDVVVFVEHGARVVFVKPAQPRGVYPPRPDGLGFGFGA